jgi:hypothetical protein
MTNVMMNVVSPLHEIVFGLEGRRVPNAKSVRLVGSFNRWDSSVHHLVCGPNGVWTVTLTLAPGRYPYLFLVDSFPWNDPRDDGRVPCEWGGHYSVRVVD